MRKVKNIANALFYASRFSACVYGLLTVYSILCFVTGWFIKIDGSYFNIAFPFTETTMLIGEHNLSYIIFSFLMVLILYGVFFWLLGNVFNVFRQPKLFTKKSIKKLKFFSLANLFIPSIATFLAYLFSLVDWDVILLIIVHSILGVFSYFLAEIFKQGVNLQNEQDLFI